MKTIDATDESPKREAILQAALSLFAERGFHGTAVPEIAARAKVGAGTVYRYFESKEALVNVLYREWKARMSESAVRDFPVGLGPRATFHEVFRRLFAFAAQNPDAMSFLELHHHASYLDRKSRVVEEASRKPLREMIVAMQKAGAVREGPPDVLMSILWGGTLGVLRGGQEGDFKADSKSTELTEECLWEAIRR